MELLNDSTSSYDKRTDWEDGYWDAFHGFPRKSTRPFYRAGYDSGLTDVLAHKTSDESL